MEVIVVVVIGRIGRVVTIVEELRHLCVVIHLPYKLTPRTLPRTTVVHPALTERAETPWNGRASIWHVLEFVYTVILIANYTSHRLIYFSLSGGCPRASDELTEWVVQIQFLYRIMHEVSLQGLRII